MKDEIDPTREHLPDRGIYRLEWGHHHTFCRIQRVRKQLVSETGTRHEYFKQYIRYYGSDEEAVLTDPDWDVSKGNPHDGSSWYAYDVDRLRDSDPAADRGPGRRPRLFLIDNPDNGGIEV